MYCGAIYEREVSYFSFQYKVVFFNSIITPLPQTCAIAIPRLNKRSEAEVTLYIYESNGFIDI